MAGDPILLFLKANAVEGLLQLVPADCPGWRETSIQASKLLRMLNDFLRKYEAKPGQSFKGYNEEVRKLFAQHRVMQARVNKLLEEHWVRSGEGTRKGFRRDQLQRLEALFDKKVYDSMQAYKKRLKGLMRGGEPKGLKD